MILLDTSILVYAVGDDHPLRAPCRRLLRAQRDGLVSAATTIEVIQEFVHVRSRRRSRPDAVALALHYARAFNLLTTSRGDLELGLQLFENSDGLGSFDALLAAVALNQQADALVSADRAFLKIPGLLWVDPSNSAFDDLVPERD